MKGPVACDGAFSTNRGVAAHEGARVPAVLAFPVLDFVEALVSRHGRERVLDLLGKFSRLGGSFDWEPEYGGGHEGSLLLFRDHITKGPFPGLEVRFATLAAAVAN